MKAQASLLLGSMSMVGMWTSVTRPPAVEPTAGGTRARLGMNGVAARQGRCAIPPVLAGGGGVAKQKERTPVPPARTPPPPPPTRSAGGRTRDSGEGGAAAL